MINRLGRNRAYFRHQRTRAIARKERIIEEVYQVNLNDYRNGNESGYVSGMLDKGKVHCSCKMCKYEKHHNIEKHKIAEKKKDMQKQIDKYV